MYSGKACGTRDYYLTHVLIVTTKTTICERDGSSESQVLDCLLKLFLFTVKNGTWVVKLKQ